jgi:5-formyltetrahydrofolate cyclo-ligase
MDDVTRQKNLLRDEIAQKRKLISSRDQKNADEKIRLRLSAVPSFSQSSAICMYASLPEEVDTRNSIEQLFQQKKNVVVPKVGKGGLLDLCRISSLSDLKPGKFHIPEPDNTHEIVSPLLIDVFIIPGVAFDRQGNRLGRGRGYYDRLLQGIRAPIIALAYDFQVIAQVPRASYDVSVPVIITEKETIIS